MYQLIKFLGFSFLIGSFLFGNAELDPMVVVALLPNRLSEASPWVSRISGDDLEQRQIYNLSDALRSVPGMAVVRSGQMGSQTSLFSRGGEKQSCYIFFMNGKTKWRIFWNLQFGELSTLNSSSVEVLRGASSSLHGANAMGGTVILRSSLP